MQRNLSRRHRPASHQLRIHSRHAPVHDSPQRIDVPLPSIIQRHHHHRRPAIHNAARVPRRHRPSFPECRTQLCQSLDRRLRTPVIVFGEHLARWLAFVIAQWNRRQLFLQTPSFICRIRQLLRAQRKFILRLPRDPLLLAIQLGRVRHVEPAIGIKQCHHQRIFQFAARRQRKPVAPADRERRLGHCLHPARQHDFRFVGLDHLRRADDRLHSRPAQPVHSQCRSLNGQPRPQPHVARPIDRVARSLLRVAEHDVIEVLRIDPRALDRRLGRHRAQFLRRIIFELPAIASKGRARPADNGNITWFQHESWLNREVDGPRPTGEFNSRKGTSPKADWKLAICNWFSNQKGIQTIRMWRIQITNHKLQIPTPLRPKPRTEERG